LTTVIHIAEQQYGVAIKKNLHRSRQEAPKRRANELKLCMQNIWDKQASHLSAGKQVNN
jgi:hypothetical protein